MPVNLELGASEMPQLSEVQHHDILGAPTTNYELFFAAVYVWVCPQEQVSLSFLDGETGVIRDRLVALSADQRIRERYHRALGLLLLFHSVQTANGWVF